MPAVLDGKVTKASSSLAKHGHQVPYSQAIRQDRYVTNLSTGIGVACLLSMAGASSMQDTHLFSPAWQHLPGRYRNLQFMIGSAGRTFAVQA